MIINDELLTRLEGLHTVETLSKALGMGRQSTINFASKLRKHGYLSSSGGGKQPRFYKITARKQLERSNGMFDILNKYSPQKLNPWYDHQVHGRYGVEEALVDAVKTGSFRAIISSLRLFNHITNWPRLYKLAKDNDCWQKIGALYDVARMHMRVKKMPENYRKESFFEKKQHLVGDYTTREEKYLNISRKWNIEIPFRNGDMRKGEI